MIALSLPVCVSQMLRMKTPRSDRVFRAATTDFPSGENASTWLLENRGPVGKRFVEFCNTSSGRSASSGHKVSPARLPVARIAPSGEKAIGPETPFTVRTSSHVEVSQICTSPRLRVARRFESRDNAMSEDSKNRPRPNPPGPNPELRGMDLASVQLAVFQIRAVVELVVTSFFPSAKKAVEKPPFGKLGISERGGEFQTLDFSRCPTAKRSPPGETASDKTGPSCVGSGMCGSPRLCCPK